MQDKTNLIFKHYICMSHLLFIITVTLLFLFFKALTGHVSAQLELQDDSYFSHKTECCNAASLQGEASRHSEIPELAFQYGGARM